MATAGIRLGLTALALSSSVWACGSSSSSDGGPGSDALAYADEYARIVCAAKAACCKAEGATQDEGHCRSLTAKVELMREVHFDPAYAAQCLAELEEYTCDGKEPDACNWVFYGTVPPGGVCKFWNDCDRPEGAMTKCSPEGSPEHTVCKLVVTAAVGEPCGGGSATEVRECAAGLVCDGTCKESLPIGADCQSGTCVEGSSCKYDAIAGSNLCMAFKAVGEDCSAQKCVDTARCGDDKICHALKKAGEACASDDDCQDVCNPDTHLCGEYGFYCL